MVIERDVDLPLKTAGLVPVRFAVPHKDQAGAFALLRKRLQVRGAVQAFDLHLWPINSRPQVEDRQRGVVDSESSESPLGFSEQGEHQATKDGVVGYHQHGAVLVNRVALDQTIHEATGLIHQFHQRAVAAAVSPFEFQLQRLALPGGEISGVPFHELVDAHARPGFKIDLQQSVIEHRCRSRPAASLQQGGCGRCRPLQSGAVDRVEGHLRQAGAEPAGLVVSLRAQVGQVVATLDATFLVETAQTVADQE